MKSTLPMTLEPIVLKPSRFIVFLALGFLLPYTKTLGEILGAMILAGVAIGVVLNSRPSRYNMNFVLISIGFLSGGEIFFRDYVFRGKFGYLSIEYVLVALAILNLPKFLNSLATSRRGKVILLWMAYCLWALITLIYSIDPLAGRWFLSIYLAGLSIFVLVISNSKFRHSIDALLSGVIAGVFLVFGTAIQFYLTSSPEFLTQTNYRFAHALCSPNQIAITLAAGIFGLMYFLLIRNRRNYITLVLLLMVALVATFSRGVLIGTLLSLFVLFAFVPWPKKVQIVLVGLVLVPVVYVLFSNLPDVFASRYQNIRIDSERLAIFEVSLVLWKTKPYLGHGIGSWAKMYPAYSYINIDAPSYVSDAHNMFLQVLVEAGLIGALLFVGFILVLVLGGIKKRSPIGLSSLGLVVLIGVAENWKLSVIYVLISLILIVVIEDDEGRLAGEN